ncbi:MAG: ferredoxin family protein [Chloroflexota bacterium]
MVADKVKGYIEIDAERCKGCGLCVFFCPVKSISLSEKVNAAGYPPASFNAGNGCTGCTSCAIVCPEVAIEVYRA